MYKGGRPIKVAVLPPEELGVEIRRQFYEVIESASYIERVALARALNMHPQSVNANWKHRRNFTNLLTAKRVIEWDKMGRPIIDVKQEISFLDLL